MSLDKSNNYVQISIDRLRILEDIEKNMYTSIQNGINENKKANLKLLHENDKLHPEKMRHRMNKYYAKNKNRIIERRLEKCELDESTVPQSTISLTVRFDT